MFLSFLLKLDLSWFVTAFIALLTYFFVKQWRLRKTLPPGPMPLPFVGNILSFAGKNVRPDEVVKQFQKKYGNTFTIWLGSEPIVIACGWEETRDALVVQRNAYSGRRSRASWDRRLLHGHTDIILSDYSVTWEVLKKLCSSALRKYVSSEKLPILVDDVIDQTIGETLKQKGPVDLNMFMYLTIYNIIATSTFGKRYSMDDSEFLSLKRASEQVNAEFAAPIASDLIPSLRPFFYRKELKFGRIANTFTSIIAKQYAEHKKSYTPGTIRDFIDALLFAKEEAKIEDHENYKHLTDENLTLVLFDMFVAGTDTTLTSLQWILLYISNQPEIQEKVRKEILENIGDRMPIQEDKASCPYTAAVISETLRMRPIVSFTIEHKALWDTTLADYKIPKDTCVLFHILSQHFDEKIWPEPEKFKPERFLNEDGSYTSARLIGYLPFSLGRRSCPGEGLAKADMFLVLARLLQKLRISLANGPGSADFEPQNVFLLNMPKRFNVNFEKL